MPSVKVDNITFDDATDFDRFVHDVLIGEGGVSSNRGDSAPLDWIFRAYEQLGSSPFASRLSKGVAACLKASEPEVRAQALVFFQSQPRAAGAERIDELVATDRSGFAGVPDPLHPGVDLEWQLLTALGNRLAAGLPKSVALGRSEALVPGKAPPFIGALTAVSPDWVIDHAEDIVRASPTAGISILIKLQGQGHDLAKLGRRIAPLCRSDARFESYVNRFIDDPATRKALLDAFGATSN